MEQFLILRVLQLQNSNYLKIDVTGVKILKISYSESNEKLNIATIYDGLLLPKKSTNNKIFIFYYI